MQKVQRPGKIQERDSQWLRSLCVDIGKTSAFQSIQDNGLKVSSKTDVLLPAKYLVGLGHIPTLLFLMLYLWGIL